MRATIAEAANQYEELLNLLHNTYWESSSVDRKDITFDLISIFNLELRELAKLSVEDQYMAYDPISSGARNVQSQLRNLQAHIDTWPLRSDTVEQLRLCIPRAAQLLTRET